MGKGLWQQFAAWKEHVFATHVDTYRKGPFIMEYEWRFCAKQACATGSNSHLLDTSTYGHGSPPQVQELARLRE